MKKWDAIFTPLPPGGRRTFVPGPRVRGFDKSTVLYFIAPRGAGTRTHTYACTPARISHRKCLHPTTLIINIYFLQNRSRGRRTYLIIAIETNRAIIIHLSKRERFNRAANAPVPGTDPLDRERNYRRRLYGRVIYLLFYFTIFCFLII